MPEIITLGEALVEIMRPVAGQALDRPGEFRGPFPSGAPAIFAVAAARLGMDTGFIGAVGADAFGRLMRKRFTAEGVDASQLQIAPGYATGAAFVAYDDAGRREFVFHIRYAAAGQLAADQIPADYFEKVKWLHISGSALALNENSRTACQRALELTLALGGKISLDPNLRLELMPLDEFRQVLRPYLEQADLLLPTEGEALLLTGLKDLQRAARKLAHKPGAIAVLKRGSQGCAIFTGESQLDIPGFGVD
jgi:sugar/nucleoside kinase (ribokinase family)